VHLKKKKIYRAIRTKNKVIVKNILFFYGNKSYFAKASHIKS